MRVAYRPWTPIRRFERLDVDSGVSLLAYRRLLVLPGVKRSWLCKLLGVLPDAVYPLLLFFLVSEQADSYALAGAVVAASGISVVILTVPAGSWVVRASGPARRGRIVALGAVSAMCMLCHPVIFWLGLAPWLHALPALLVSGAAPPFASMLRARWDRLIENHHDKHLAHGWENAWSEAWIALGPVLAGVAFATGLIAWWFVAGAIMIAAGALLLLALDAANEVESFSGGAWKALTGTSGARRALVLEGVSCAAWSALVLAVMILGREQDQEVWAGVSVGAISLGTALGGILYSARLSDRPLVQDMTTSFVLLALGAIGMLVAPPDWPLIVLVCLAIGTASAPLAVGVFVAVDRIMDEGQHVVAYQGLSLAAATAAALTDASTGMAGQLGGATGALGLTALLGLMGMLCMLWLPIPQLSEESQHLAPAG